MSTKSDTLGIQIANYIIGAETVSTEYRNNVQDTWKQIASMIEAANFSSFGTDEISILTQIKMNTGIILPLYIYPADVFNNTTFNQIVEMKKKYKNVPLVAILNPSDGPGTVVDGNYRVAAKMLQGAGATVIGYVSTLYGARDFSDVTDDIDKWKTLYPMIEGIFFDEMRNDWIPDLVNPYSDVNWHYVQHYIDLKNYAKTALLNLTIGNPGADTPEIWFNRNVMDIIVTYENSGYPTMSLLQGSTAYEGSHMHYPYWKRSALCYNVPTLVENTVLEMSKYTGLLYVNTDNLPNPWDSIPSYLETLFEYLSKK